MIEVASPKIYRPQDGSLVLHIDAADYAGGKAIDRSSKLNQGTITGAVLKTGSVGQNVYSFDGTDDFINCGNGSSLNIASSLTVLCWFNTTTLTRGDIVTIWKLAGANSKFDLLHGVTSAKPQFYVSSSTASKNSGTGATSIVINRWYQIGGVYNDVANTVAVFLDGKIQASAAADIILNTTSMKPLIIGGNFQTDPLPNNEFSGKLNDVRLYNRALGASEIMELYQVTKHLYGY